MSGSLVRLLTKRTREAARPYHKSAHLTSFRVRMFGDVEDGAKFAEWKGAIAREMTRTTTATNPWLAKALAMGHPSRVCNLVNGI